MIVENLLKLIQEQKFRKNYPKGFCPECGARAEDVYKIREEY